MEAMVSSQLAQVVQYGYIDRKIQFLDQVINRNAGVIGNFLGSTSWLIICVMNLFPVLLEELIGCSKRFNFIEVNNFTVYFLKEIN